MLHHHTCLCLLTGKLFVFNIVIDFTPVMYCAWFIVSGHSLRHITVLLYNYSLTSDLENLCQHCPLMRCRSVLSFIQITLLCTEILHHAEQVSTDNSRIAGWYKKTVGRDTTTNTSCNSFWQFRKIHFWVFTLKLSRKTTQSTCVPINSIWWQIANRSTTSTITHSTDWTP